MLFAVLFTDKLGCAELRARYLQPHIQWVRENQGRVLVAGSLRTEPEAVAKGGLWIVEAASRQEVEELMQTDPFYACGLRQSWEILHWRKALDQKVPV